MGSNSRRKEPVRTTLALALTLFAVAAFGPSTALANHNDNVAAAVDLLLNSSDATSNVSATVQTGEPRTVEGPGFCGASTELEATIWWRIIGNGGVISINTSGSNFDTVLAVYRAPDPLIEDLPCNDDADGLGQDSRVSFQSVAGQPYLIQVGGCRMCGAQSEGPTGNVVLNVNCLLYTSPSPRDRTRSRMPSSA